MTTKTLYLAQMKWCEWEEPICIGTNKKKVSRGALKMLKEKYGTGPVSRGAAMCSIPITMTDIEIVKLPVVE